MILLWLIWSQILNKEKEIKFQPLGFASCTYYITLAACIMQCAIYAVHITTHFVSCSVSYTVYTTDYIVSYTMYTTDYSVPCTVYTTYYSVSYTVYTTNYSVLFTA